jgi:hypothetical protein
VGCSAESEASFETISFLAKKADELSLPVLLTTETSDGSIAETVKNTSQSKNQQILVMNAMQSVTADKLNTGITYLQTMREEMTLFPIMSTKGRVSIDGSLSTTIPGHYVEAYRRMQSLCYYWRTHFFYREVK